MESADGVATGLGVSESKVPGCTASESVESQNGQDLSQDEDLYFLTKKIMRYIDKGTTIDKIQKKTGADRTFIEDVTRMYLTHTNVGVRGILDRIEIKGR